MRAITLLVVALAATAPSKPQLVVRAFPLIQQAGPNGIGQVTLTAEIIGPETEEWYCPKIEWEFPDRTRAMQESDCPPFEKRNQCMESQEGCGFQGIKWDPDKLDYEDIVKECPCTIMGYPNRWTMRKGGPPHPEGDFWEVKVRLIKNNKTLAYQTVRFMIK